MNPLFASTDRGAATTRLFTVFTVIVAVLVLVFPMGSFTFIAKLFLPSRRAQYCGEVELVTVVVPLLFAFEIITCEIPLLSVAE